MAWTAPTTRSTSDLITAAHWNTDLTDNLTYLKTQTDLLDDMSQTNAAAGRAINTVYQNTSGKIRIVSIALRDSIPATTRRVYTTILCDADNPPVTVILGHTAHNNTAGALNFDVCLTIPIPINYYYKVHSDFDSVVYWTEYDLY